MNALRNLLTFLTLTLASISGWAGDAKFTLDIKPQPLVDAISEFAQQSGLQVVFNQGVGKGLMAPAIVGDFSAEDALAKLLANTRLRYEFLDTRTIAIRPGPDLSTKSTADLARAVGVRLALSGTESMQKVEASPSRDPEASSENSKGIPEILVKGNRSLNADIVRTEDAPQPYVVFEREEIERSQALNLNEFLRTRLPMNTTAASAAQQVGNPNNTSSINLRGLGTNQTLILVDGRRLLSNASGGDVLFQSNIAVGQADINGIPLSAIERIEVLPSTAGGIYGGSATGGVINIILRRDFTGLEGSLAYGNTFDTDAGNVRIDVSGGFALEGGRTQIMLSGSHSQANTLVLGDRDFSVRSVALALQNNPAGLLASSIPPLGATVNIRSQAGELVLDPAYGSTALGSMITHIPLGYAGPASDGAASLRANAGEYNLALPAGVNGVGRGLVAVPVVDSAVMNVRRSFGGRLEGFVDFSRFGNKGSSYTGYPEDALPLPGSAPNNPFQQAIWVRFPSPDLALESRSSSVTVKATAGLIARLPREWTAEMDLGWGRSSFESVMTASVTDSAGGTSMRNGLPAPDGRPALNVLQEGNTFPLDLTPYLLQSPNQFLGPFDTVLEEGTMRFSGPALTLPGGPLILSALIERRAHEIRDSFSTGVDTVTRNWEYIFYPSRSQDTDSVYTEARVPLVAAANRMKALRELELQLSVRHDRYTTSSVPASSNVQVPSLDGPFPALSYTTTRLDSTDYTVGLRVMPVEGLQLRTSFSTGFLPPSVLQIVPSSRLLFFGIGTDPRRGNTNIYTGTTYTYISGGNPDLKPERSRSWSAGAILTPQFAPGFRFSLDYTRIGKVDEIQSPNIQYMLDNESLYSSRIVRGSPRPTDPPGWAAPIVSLNGSLVNIARTTVEAWDMQADYIFQTARYGEFRAYAVATWASHYLNQLRPGVASVDSVGYQGGPLKWRGNVGLDWTAGALSVGWNAQYYDAYRVYAANADAFTMEEALLNQGSAVIPSQIYNDVIATYRFGNVAGVGAFLNNSELSVGIQNIFDRSPPVIASFYLTEGSYSTYGDPRLRRYSVSLRKRFQ